MKLVTEQQHIDYHFTGLEDDDRDDVDGDNDEDDDPYDAPDDGELSFDRGQNDQERDVVSTEQNSMEVIADQETHLSCFCFHWSQKFNFCFLCIAIWSVCCFCLMFLFVVDSSECCDFTNFHLLIPLLTV